MTLRFAEGVRVVGLLSLWTVMVAPTAQGQLPPMIRGYQHGWQRPNPQQQMEAMALKTSGSVEMVGPGVIQITTNAGEGWQLHLTANTQVEVRGMATPEFLSPGQCISFVATVDKRQTKVEEKIGKLTVFTPDDEHNLGAFPAGSTRPGPLGAGPAGERRDPDQQPGLALPGAKVGPGTGKAHARSSKASGSSKTAAGRGTAPAAETMELAGRITRIKNGEITISVPNFKSSLRLELTEQPQIDVHLWGSDIYGWAKKGDKIQVEGMKAPEQMAQGGQVDVRRAQAGFLSIQLAEPLGSSVEKKPARRAASGRAKGQPAGEPQDPASTPKKLAQ